MQAKKIKISTVLRRQTCSEHVLFECLINLVDELKIENPSTFFNSHNFNKTFDQKYLKLQTLCIWIFLLPVIIMI